MEVFFVLARILGIKRKPISIGESATWGLILLIITTLGYFGGELVLGATDPNKVETNAENQIKPEQFNKYCSACHPKGGNKFKSHFPLRNAPQLANFETFLAYIRAPKARDGSLTIMMQFPAKILSEEEAREIYQYIVEVLRKD